MWSAKRTRTIKMCTRVAVGGINVWFEGATLVSISAGAPNLNVTVLLHIRCDHHQKHAYFHGNERDKHAPP